MRKSRTRSRSENNINTVSASCGEVERHRKEQVKHTGMLKSICYPEKKILPVMGIWGQQMPGLPNEGPQQLPAQWQDEGQCKGTHFPPLQKADLHGNAAATAENTITLTLKEWKGSNFKKLNTRQVFTTPIHCNLDLIAMQYLIMIIKHKFFCHIWNWLLGSFSHTLFT